MSIEDRFLTRLSRGAAISDDEYGQMIQDLPPDVLAPALAKRHLVTGETQVLVEAARLYAAVGFDYEALELCSRAPRLRQLQQIVQKLLPRLRRDYPDVPKLGKLLDETFLVIDLQTGTMARFQPIMPATMTSQTTPVIDLT